MSEKSTGKFEFSEHRWSVAVLGILTLAISWPLAAASDPTRPPADRQERPAAVVVPADLPEVTLIITAADRSRALIDGQIRVEGDSISGARILRIERDHVVLQTGNGNATVHINVTKTGISRRQSSGEQ